ncbi:MAG: succinyl-diaminopimelate desuccinylase [Alphaproteobacteria bacterium]|nr:MAG: succinyl-diaminopimelate desuccinylase [Alphaproteobacteria bacterium]
MAIDPVALAAELVRCPSVTPAEGGALALLDRVLTGAGFDCVRIDRGGTPNLLARWGGGRPVIGLAGHTDVVPPGDPAAWSVDPFGGVIRDGYLWGRGACDMKSAVAAFAAAAAGHVAARPGRGGIMLLITGDEEGPGTDGTRAILDWMAARGLTMDACLVGEPTCPERLGEMVKIGRRGSLTARILAEGVQGHSAYPQRAANPLPVLVRFLDRVASAELDRGSDHFEPSTLAVTGIDTGNDAANVIPARARAMLNIRFNDRHRGADLLAWLRGQAARAAEGSGVTLTVEASWSDAFLTEPGPFIDLVAGAVEAETGLRPVLSTSGGTSDARFIKDHCPVAEFGLVGQTMHQVDERAAVADIRALAAIYRRILDGFMA